MQVWAWACVHTREDYTPAPCWTGLPPGVYTLVKSVGEHGIFNLKQPFGCFQVRCEDQRFGITFNMFLG